jgi:lipopolysaccharide/colanic/teichoic acid biosynthesis glycosyltransferase
LTKRLIDIFISLLGIILLFPIIVITSLVIRVKLGKGILFKQLRLGKNGMPFTLIKFRTMSIKTKNNFSDADRMCKVGQFLRSFSIDELPSLLNVMKGNMSIVGPRPLLIEYQDLYSKEEYRRHEVLPGLTGWAQVNGRNSLDWEEKFKLDVWYVDNKSLLLDFKIIFLTFKKVLLREGISQNGEVTMRPFKGKLK